MDFNKMPAGQRVDYILFKRILNNVILEWKQESDEYEKVQWLFPFADFIYRLEQLRRRGAYLNSPQVASTLYQINKQIDSLSATLKNENEI